MQSVSLVLSVWSVQSVRSVNLAKALNPGYVPTRLIITCRTIGA